MVTAMDRAANAVSQNEGSMRKLHLDPRIRISLLSGEANKVSSSGAGTGR